MGGVRGGAQGGPAAADCGDAKPRDCPSGGAADGGALSPAAEGRGGDPGREADDAGAVRAAGRAGHPVHPCARWVGVLGAWGFGIVGRGLWKREHGCPLFGMPWVWALVSDGGPWFTVRG